ncbi:DUF1615 domain-containing protein [uncultured Piscinibacter sp.]|uniref:DUF1615 domain-containing protein n=1 Tax=uncultured Piscinibacter sp. TaxID=1131835 RepID=UPI002618AE00|nr:DUF1615 domain-containing protein [uncultured Piscinibacter sp.]
MPRHATAATSALAAASLLAGCALPPSVPQGMGPTEAREAVLRVLPAHVDDRAGWATDIHAALATLALPSTPGNLCAVLAVTEQESGFRADPVVPGLAAIASKEIERRAGSAGVPMLAVRAALALSSPDGRSYAERIRAAKTERQLSEVFEDFVDMVPLGRTFLADRNPVRTGGPMQVSIAFAQAHAEERSYPYPVPKSLRREVFTRRGGLYFGTAHLLDYDAPYDDMRYRFADFNAGRFASRNAAFQQALAVASGLPVAQDGDLLPRAAGAPRGETERAAATLAGRLGLSEAAIRRDLESGDTAGFEQSRLYGRVFAYAEQLDRRTLPRAVVPRIDLHSPKFTRRLTTEWFTQRVDERHRRCLARMPAPRDD